MSVNQNGHHDTIWWYLDTWSGFEAGDSTTFVSSLIEPSDGWAGRGCCCFLMRWHSWAFLAHHTCRIELQNLLSSNLNFSVLTLSMYLRYFGNELYNRGPNTVTVIAFSWSHCAGFLFVGYWIKPVFHVLGAFWFLFCSHCAINIWHYMLCYLPNINI